MTVGALLRAEGLSASYDGRQIFSGASLSLGPGLYALRGANGSGKSTLLRLLAGAQLPDGGETWIAGANLRRARALHAGSLATRRTKVPFIPS